MSETLSEYEIRKQKVHALEEQGVSAFPAHAQRSATVEQFLESFTEGGAQATLVGRLRLKREHGKLAFAQLEDESGRVQLVFSKNDLGEEKYNFFADLFDVGDIVQVSGTPFVTKKGEESVLVSDVVMLTKAIRGLPDKWKGIQDEEMRYRRRYVDMIMRPELRDMFYKKSVFWNSLRDFLRGEGFLEVETPVLESTPGGADAAPFVTHHNALDIDVFLRISMGELWQKRLMVAGFEKTFEIGRQFRNEGMSPEHLQDYTQMEFYWAYADYTKGMKLCERMYKHCIMQTFGTLQFNIRGFDVDLDQEWGELDYTEAVKQGTGVDITTASVEELQAKCDELGVEYEPNDGKGRIIDSLWKYCRKSIGGPVFLVNHPVEVSPLAKRRPENPETVERFQIIIAGSELGNGYSELNDPIDQAARFEEQAKLREAGDDEAQMHDQDFVEALEYGMPPTCGFGLSERVFAFLLDKPVREAVMFPLMRPKQEVSGDDEVSETVEPSEPAVSSEDDQTLAEFDAGITRDEAEAWVYEHVEDENLRRHMLATEVQMYALAERFGAKSPEAWAVAGLLHDIDYELVANDLTQHSLKGAEMLQERSIHPDVVDAVREHNGAHGIEPKTLMSKCLLTLEQLTGLVSACTFVRPDKSVHSVEVKSVKKKFKDKSFARGVMREEIKQCEERLGMSLDEAIEITLTAMQQHAEKLNLQGEQ